MTKQSRTCLMLAAAGAWLLSSLLVYYVARPRGEFHGTPEGNSPARGLSRTSMAAHVGKGSPGIERLTVQGAARAVASQPADPEAPANAKALDRIPDEHVIRFGDNADLRRFISLAQAQGAAILGVLDRWDSVRLGGLSPEALRDLLGQGFLPLEIESNVYVRVPTYPVHWGDEAPFRDGALRWLGVRGDNSKWGDGVTVAILDNGVGIHSALDQVSIARINLLQDGGGAGGEYGGHATAIASIIAGASPELHGVSPATRLLSIQVVNSDGIGDAFTLAQGIVTAVDQGAAVINVSLGSRGDSFVMRQAVEYAIENGVAVVAATGNDGAGQVDYPAGYEGVIAVSAVDANGQHADYANRGDGVKVSAPGAGVYAAWTEDQLVSFSGTSAAAPFVSGALASILSEGPDLTVPQAVDLLLQYTDDGGAPGPDPEYGRGILDLGRVQSRNQPGIVDAALSSNCVDTANATDQTIPILVCAQNRGTETLPQVQINTVVDGVPGVFVFGPVNVGETVYGTLSLSVSALQVQGTVGITSAVTVPGCTDANPANNARNTVVVLTQPEPPAGKTP